MTNLQTTLCELVSTKMNVDQESVADGASFEDLDLDSLELIELSVVLEDQFGVNVADDEITIQFTVADLTKLLLAKGVAS